MVGVSLETKGTPASKLKEAFVEVYGSSPDEVHVFFAPGRVNLMGDHTDYNGGLVFPAAISLGTYAAVRYTAFPHESDRVIRVRSLNAPGEVRFGPGDLEQAEPDPADIEQPDLVSAHLGASPSRAAVTAQPLYPGSWTAYPEGVVRYLSREGMPVPGCDLLFLSDLPIGAGLSSSAALELVTAYALLEGKDLDRVWLAKLCRRVENEFVGVGCGIMDQFIVAMGKRGCAVLLDCQGLQWRYIPVDTGPYSFIVMDSRKERTLAASAYNERRAQCDEAFRLIAPHKAISNLCQASVDDILKRVDDPVLQKRARHVVTENQRTRVGADLLSKGDLAGFGALMTQSHRSLRDDYEVTGFELDVLVDAALRAEGCLGARMTGAGFGGCALALVKSDRLETFEEEVSKVYRESTGMSLTFYPVTFVDGVRKI